MNELRKDYILDRWVIIAEDRGKRPQQFVHRAEKVEKGICYFCPGNENMTPPEIARIERNGRWIVRSFPNKFPATSRKKGKIRENFLKSFYPYGTHEVVVETPEHDKNLGDLDKEHISLLLQLYIKRLREIKEDKSIKYVLIFKNKGGNAGTSLEHSHSQIIGLPIIPKLVQDEVLAAEEYRRRNGNCPFCKIWKREIKTERGIFENEHTVAIAPFASRFPFEVWLIPKRHMNSLEEMKNEEINSFAEILQKILSRLNSSLNYPPYNFYLHLSPEGEDLHFHLELTPRLTKWAGFELGSGIIINVMPPEMAAEHYRGKN